jgi:hypothetical protein
VKVYAGTDPLTGREIQLHKTSKTERAAQTELGKLLEQAAAGRQEPRTCRSQLWPRPLYSVVDGVLTPSVLSSYGLFVNTHGQLESPANADAPTRLINTLIAPGGYLGKWMRANSATRSLVMLYRSPYPVEAAYGFVAQQQSGAAQLVTNTKGGVSAEVGMSMAPAFWLVNFIDARATLLL